MQPPVFFIVGKPQHGKTTVRQIVSKQTYLKGGSCSDIVYHFLAARRGVSIDVLRSFPKEALRPALIDAGNFLCGVGAMSETAVNITLDEAMYRHPSALIRTLYLSGYNVIDGVRRRQEIQHAREHLDWNGVRSFVIKVDRPGVPDIVDNTEDLSEFADDVVLNDGTIEELEVKVKAVIEKHFGSQENPEQIPVVDLPPKQPAP